jgi:hypothetical protein
VWAATWGPTSCHSAVMPMGASGAAGLPRAPFKTFLGADRLLRVGVFFWHIENVQFPPWFPTFGKLPCFQKPHHVRRPRRPSRGPAGGGRWQHLHPLQCSGCGGWGGGGPGLGPHAAISRAHWHLGRQRCGCRRGRRGGGGPRAPGGRGCSPRRHGHLRILRVLCGQRRGRGRLGGTLYPADDLRQPPGGCAAQAGGGRP